MADPLTSDTDPGNLDGLRGRPTFVQIHPPAPVGSRGKWVAGGIVGAVLIAALGWASYRLTLELNTHTATPAKPVQHEPVAAQPAPVDVSPELVTVTIDSAVSSPAWTRTSLMEWVSPFDPSASARDVHAAVAEAEAGASESASTGSYQLSVRLGKGETIGSALQKRGFAPESVAEAVAALAPHVSLKRLPIGLVMTLRVQPAEQDARPVLQALTLQADARREITVARDGEGNYAVLRR